MGSISSTSASHIAASGLRSNHSNYYPCLQFSSILSSLLSQWKYTTGWAGQNNQEERLEQAPICCLHQSLLGQVITIIIIITVRHVLLYQSCRFLNIIQNAFDHPALKRQDRLGKDPFAGFGTVVEDITESGYTKNQPILLGPFWENAFFVFLHYKINGSKGVFWP